MIPVRDFANTKIRLAGLITERQRADLTRSMLLRVLDAVEGSSVVEDTVVVASNPKEVSDALGGRRVKSVEVIREPNWRGGVNGAMQAGMRYINQKDIKGKGKSQFMLMPSDLPLLESRSVKEMLALKESCEIIINPSRKKDGTSLLVMERGRQIPLHYDDNSFQNHLAEARKAGLDVRVVDFPQFSFDLDDEQDLKLLSEKLKSPDFEGLIRALQHKNSAAPEARA